MSGPRDTGDLEDSLHRLTVAQYDEMARAGILGPDDRVELLEGLLVEKMTKDPPHRIATRRMRVALERVVPAGWYVDSQEPIVTPDSEPEPDVAAIRGRTEDYSEGNPPAEQVGLVVEVADVTLGRDRVAKGRIYARARIATYWIVDLSARQLEVYSDPAVPDGAGYRSRVIHAAEDRVPVVLGGSVVGTLAVSDLLP